MYNFYPSKTMAFKIFPTSIAGIQLPFNQLKGPLSRLWSNDKKENLYYPQDIGTNPAHCHVVQISIFEYTTDLGEGLAGGADVLNNIFDTAGNALTTKKAVTDLMSMGIKSVRDFNNKIQNNSLGENISSGIDLIQQGGAAKTYRVRPAGDSLANISLYMPDSLNVDYSSNYSDVSLTKTLGAAGTLSSFISEMGGGAGIVASAGKGPANLMSDAAKTASAKNQLTKAVEKIFGESAGQIAGQSLNQIVNPQIQLVYQGIGLREFQLDFIFTPKSSYEAQMTKNIIDTLVYYSSPGYAGFNTNNQQQFLTPPQLFNVKFLFTGKSGLENTLTTVFNKALTNIGLDFLTSDQNRLSVNADHNINNKLFSIGDCVLKDVQVDYAPNGWAAFDDGHPVQTRVSLRFQEINIVTKDRLATEGHTARSQSQQEKDFAKSLGDFMG
jgi:hypothetical protein